jgi:succinate dehydrogenase / fumarate reductase cytochrome b subunit
MADSPHPLKAHSRPLSPFVTIYKWSPAMASSITHRVTGVGLALGTVFLAWWLIASANGPESYGAFMTAAANPVGQIVLFGFVWSLSYHLLNGIRHLAWDLGYGYTLPVANGMSVVVFALSIVLAAGVFAYAYASQRGLVP